MLDYKNNEAINDEKEDRLDRWEKAKDLAEYINDVYTLQSKKEIAKSYNIAIRGQWGEGKSSFINLTKKQLKNPKDIKIIEFDLWYFPYECDIHEQFFSLVDNRKNIILRWIIGYFCCLCIMSFNIFDPFFEAIINTSYIKCVLDFISRVTQNFKQTYFIFICSIGIYSIVCPNNIKSLFSKIRSILSSDPISDFLNNFAKDKFDPVETKKQLEKLTEGRKLLVIIDNIDRLYPHQIKRVFDLVKGIGDLPNIIYILAFDNKVVSKALNKDRLEEGSKYLDKFIQYPVDLYTSYEELVIKEITEAFPNQESSRYYASELSQYITNLRDLKRLINTFKQKHTKLQEDVNFGQLLYITAISLQNNAIYQWLANSKDILCSEDQDKNAPDKLKKLKEEIDNLKPPSILLKIIESLFPITRHKNGETFGLYNGMKIKQIDHPDYFDSYFKISFPDYLVSESDFQSLIAIAGNKDELTTSLLKLLRLSKKEEEQKIPNRIANPFKWLDNLTARLLDSSGRLWFGESKNIPNWLLSLAKVTEEYADYVETTEYHELLGFHSFLGKVALLLKTESPAKDDSFPIYAFLRIYLNETEAQRESCSKTEELKNLVIKNIEKYSENNNISQLSFFEKIIACASRDPQEHEAIVKIIKESIKEDDAFLELILFSIHKSDGELFIQDGKAKISKYLEYYISFKEAAQRLEKIKQSGSGKSHDIYLYINSLSDI